MLCHEGCAMLCSRKLSRFIVQLASGKSSGAFVNSLYRPSQPGESCADLTTVGD